jgi:hypothetical protein
MGVVTTNAFGVNRRSAIRETCEIRAAGRRRKRDNT